MSTEAYYNNYYDEDDVYGDAYVHTTSSKPQHSTIDDKASFLCGTQQRSVPVQEVLGEMYARAQKMASICQIPIFSSLIWLRENRWSVNDAVAVMLNDDAGVTFRRACSGEADAKQWIPLGDSRTTVTCMICCEDVPASTMWHLDTCDVSHSCCVSCWKGQLRAKIEEMDMLGFHCFADGKCAQIIGIDLLLRVIDAASPEDEGEHLKSGVLKAYIHDFVKREPTLALCPLCPLSLLFAPSGSLPDSCETECVQCHRVFCFKCGAPVHAPCTCDELNQWELALKDGGANMGYIQEHTKQCPKCLEPIEKNRGCNHMSCRCKHEFCWVCLGDWKAHTGSYYACSAANAENHPSALGNDETLFQCVKYFNAHKKSAELERRDFSYARQSFVRHFTSRGCSTAQAEKKARLVEETLIRNRSVLQNCYIHEYFMLPNQAFNFVRGELERITEALSECLTLARSNEPFDTDVEELVKQSVHCVKAIFAP